MSGRKHWMDTGNTAGRRVGAITVTLVSSALLVGALFADVSGAIRGLCLGVGLLGAILGLYAFRQLSEIRRREDGGAK